MNSFAIGWMLAASFLSAPFQHDHGSRAPQKQADSASLQLPLKGLMGDCCNQAIEQAFKGVKGLHSVKVGKSGDRPVVAIVMKSGEGLPLSEFKKALDVATQSMGASMGTKYEIDGALPSSSAHFYRTSSAPDEADLKKALSSLKGYKGVWVKKAGFSPRFSDEAAPSVDEVVKASGLEVAEIILAPAIQGKRYACPMHPEKVSVSAKAKCTACGMAMVEVVVKE